MENNEVKKENVNQEQETATEKKTLKEKIALKKEEIKAKHEARKAAREGKPGIGKKILAGAGIATLVVGAVAAGIACKNRTGSDELYDTEEGPEPGDDCYETEESIEENSGEEVVEE